MDPRPLLDRGAERLKTAGIETPRVDAELLLADAVSATRSAVAAGLVEVEPEQRETFESSIQRRATREPLQHIVGKVGFRRIELSVDGRALIPRPETELLVAVVKVDRPCGILDVATGSGAVALALADELPDATITASDISADALELASENARALAMGDRVRFVRSDLLDAVEGSFDAIAANLPYVEADEIAALQPEVAQFEPRLALDGGGDGLDLVRRLAAQAPARLKPGGALALEIGLGQARATAEILAQNGFTDVEIHEDLAGIERVVVGRSAR